MKNDTYEVKVVKELLMKSSMHGAALTSGISCPTAIVVTIVVTLFAKKMLMKTVRNLRTSAPPTDTPQMLTKKITWQPIMTRSMMSPL